MQLCQKIKESSKIENNTMNANRFPNADVLLKHDGTPSQMYTFSLKIYLSCTNCII
jgi:hypothetical protein